MSFYFFPLTQKSAVSQVGMRSGEQSQGAAHASLQLAQGQCSLRNSGRASDILPISMIHAYTGYLPNIHPSQWYQSPSFHFEQTHIEEKDYASKFLTSHSLQLRVASEIQAEVTQRNFQAHFLEKGQASKNKFFFFFAFPHLLCLFFQGMQIGWPTKGWCSSTLL